MLLSLGRSMGREWVRAEAAGPREGAEGQDWEQHISGPPHGHAWELHSSFLGQEVREGGVASFVGQHTILGGGAPPWCYLVLGWVGQQSSHCVPSRRGAGVVTYPQAAARTLDAHFPADSCSWQQWREVKLCPSPPRGWPRQGLPTLSAAVLLSPPFPTRPTPRCPAACTLHFRPFCFPSERKPREGPGQHAHV